VVSVENDRPLSCNHSLNAQHTHETACTHALDQSSSGHAKPKHRSIFELTNDGEHMHFALMQAFERVTILSRQITRFLRCIYLLFFLSFFRSHFPPCFLPSCFLCLLLSLSFLSVFSVQLYWFGLSISLSPSLIPSSRVSRFSVCVFGGCTEGGRHAVRRRERVEEGRLREGGVFSLSQPSRRR